MDHHAMQCFCRVVETGSFATAARINNPLYNASAPAFVALPRDAFDVMRCLACAARAGVRATVKSGGHSFAGYSTIAAPGMLATSRRCSWACQVPSCAR